jgi:hypothetical protein
MAGKSRFVLIELLMEAVCVTGLLVMIALMAFQSSAAASALTSERAARHLAAMKSDLRRVAEQQVLHYLDSSEFAHSPEDLRFVSSDGVAIELTGSEDGWAATASHDRLGESHGCAIFYGSVRAPSTPVAPRGPGEVFCTE